jgi:hypothetical protein
VVSPDEKVRGPFVVTRYSVTIRQVIVWPNSADLPKVGAEASLDISGGTIGCFTVEAPGAIGLAAGQTYLAIAGVRDPAHLILWDDSQAMPVTGGALTAAPDPKLLTVLQSFAGQQLDDLPELIVVESKLTG